MRWVRWLVGIAFLTAMILRPPTAIAQEGSRVPTDDEVNAIAKKLYCPVCPNTPLDVCETLACRDWREQIRDQLAAGWTEEQIITYFVERYGQRVLAEPQRKGFAALAWVLPVIAVAVGLAIVIQVLRAWRARRALATAPPTPASVDVPPEVVARVEKEIKDLW